jgi:hypothetical protein
MFSPTKSALLQAVKNGHLITSPGLTEQAINKHLRLTPATAMGHMNQRRQNIRSTLKTPITYDMEDAAVTPAGLVTNTHLVYAVVVDQGQLYTDLTGNFPVRSSKGVKLPQPQLRTRTYTQTGQSTLRATQVRAALSHAYAVTYQNRITDKP